MYQKDAGAGWSRERAVLAVLRTSPHPAGIRLPMRCKQRKGRRYSSKIVQITVQIHKRAPLSL